MHYYIDGYNLLFYLFGTDKNDLRSQRDQIIQSLNIKIESLSLDLTVVFDSHLCPGEASRSHFHHLEVLYTDEGITADDYIIQLIAGSKNPTQEVVVTNDRELSMRAKHQCASSQSIETFLNWLNRRYSNLTKKKATESKKLPKHSLESAFSKMSKANSSSSKSQHPIPQKQKSSLKLEQPARVKLIPLPIVQQPIEDIEERIPEKAPGSLEFYLSQFQSAHEEILKQEKNSKPEKKNKPESTKKKRLSSLFNDTSQVNLHVSDVERWLKIFEKRDEEN